MLQNARVTAFMVSELLRENQQEGGGGVKLPPPRLELKLGIIDQCTLVIYSHRQIIN